MNYKNIQRYLHKLAENKFAALLWRRRLLAGASLAGGFMAGFLLWSTYAAQQVPVSFASKQSCVASPRLLPGASQFTGQTPFAITRPASLSIGPLPLYARTVCVTTAKVPRQNATAIAHEKVFGFVGKRTIVIKTPAYPLLAVSDAMRKVPPDRPLTLPLSNVDSTFTYSIKHGTRTHPCQNKGMQIQCDIRKLGLAYAQRYSLSVSRSFKGVQAGAAKAVAVQTITPTKITHTTIAPGAVVQDKPGMLTITTDKPLKTVGKAVLVTKTDTGEANVPITTTYESGKIVVRMHQELPRKKTYELRLNGLEATDLSGLEGGVYSMQFTTSGGPRIKSSGVGSRNISRTPTFTLRLDQAVMPNQDIKPILTVKVNGVGVAFASEVRGDQIIVRPSAPLPLCAKVTLTAANTIQNQYGVGGDSGWSFSTRAICYATFTIGSSVKGRPITAYQFGTGSQYVVYMGAMHGSEQGTKRLMDEWFSQLNSDPDRIPAGRSIIVIPAVNPDGYAANSRLNANGIDINRNFASNDWKQQVTLPGSSAVTNAGGPNPLSEPESRAIANYISRIRPRLVISYHSKASIVEANESGDSVAVAAGYASRARYRAVPRSQTGNSFAHDTTGAMEDWMRERLGLPCIVIELSTHAGSDFARNKNALWYTAATVQ